MGNRGVAGGAGSQEKNLTWGPNPKFNLGKRNVGPKTAGWSQRMVPKGIPKGIGRLEMF